MLKILDKVILNFFLLIPVGLITGPLIPDLLLSSICILFLIKNFFENDLKILKNKYFFIFILICFFLITLSLFSDNPKLSLESTLFYFRFGIFTLAIYFLMNSYHEILLKRLFFILILIFVFLIIGQILDFIYEKNILTSSAIKDFRHLGFFGKNEVIGSYAFRFFPLLIYLSIRKNLDKSYISLLTCLVGLIIILSGERTSLFFYLLTLFLFFLTLPIILKKNFFFNLLLIVIITFFFAANNKNINTRIFQTFDQLFKIDKNNKIKFFIFSEVHESHYKVAYKMFKEKPLFGHGPKLFRHYCSKKENYVNKYACTTHPHNNLMQFLSETGLLFTLLIYLSYFFILKNFFKNLTTFKKKNNFNYPKIFLSISIILTFFPFSPAGNFFNNWLSVIYYYPLGLYLWQYSHQRT